ncbi:hypothetical protein BC829DRAFT_394735 [Chytridium lagenaria]|nr:hypothetical protein BC829DRAFT_394735 [Chytridium lagenaria]
MWVVWQCLVISQSSLPFKWMLLAQPLTLTSMFKLPHGSIEVQALLSRQSWIFPFNHTPLFELSPIPLAEFMEDFGAKSELPVRQADARMTRYRWIFAMARNRIIILYGYFILIQFELPTSLKTCES